MNELNKILAIETSSELCSAAIFFAPNQFDERNILIKHIHSEKLIPIIDELLISNSLTTKDLNAVAISNGPGSFTGLRIGMTAAKGIAYASNLPIILVPTLESLAFEISQYLNNETEFIIAINANIEEFYYSKFFKAKNQIKILDKVCLKSKNEIEKLITDSDNVFGNLSIIKNNKPISSPRAISIAKWAYFFGKDLLTFDYDYIEPNYLKNFKVKSLK